ncbi:MAG TPA: DUF1579 family protein [Planctomycetota bacterium]|nr:DUF1579 family protein [Planctomycetota bacterium]
MSRTALALCLALLPSALVAGGAPTVQEKEKKPSMPPDMQEQMRRWTEACTPNENHKKLADWIGKWDTKTTMTGMGAEPMVSTGTAEARWLLEGRWLQEEWTGEIMGKKTRGFVTMGYDNFKRKYVVSFVDSYQTTLNVAEGAFDQTGKVLLAYGWMDEPMTGEQDKMVKYVWRLLSPDKRIFEVHDLAIGESNTKVYEVEYTRRK